MRNHLILTTATAAVLLASACGGESATTTATPTPTATSTATSTTTADDPDRATVTLLDLEFSPPDVTVGAGGTVTWTNEDLFDHTVTSADGSSLDYDSGAIGQDASFEVTYDTAGTYDYFCQIHPSMRGTVTVTE